MNEVEFVLFKREYHHLKDLIKKSFEAVHLQIS